MRRIAIALSSKKFNYIEIWALQIFAVTCVSHSLFWATALLLPLLGLSIAITNAVKPAGK